MKLNQLNSTNDALSPLTTYIANIEIKDVKCRRRIAKSPLLSILDECWEILAENQVREGIKTSSLLYFYNAVRQQ